MKFSIITPSHKLTYIIELYNSILAQTYDDWEWILYLNGSAKQEVAGLPYCLTSNPKIHIHYDDTTNTNVGYLKNKAFHLGTGDVLVEVDHDDLILPNCLQRLYDTYSTNPDVGFVYSDNAKWQADGGYNQYNSAMGWKHADYEYNGQKLYCPESFEPSAQSMAFIWFEPDHVRSWRKDVYESVGGHNITYSVLDDQELMIRTYLVTKFMRIPECLYIYRVMGDNTWLQRNEQIQTGTVQLYHQYAFQLAERDTDLRGLLKVDLGGGIDKMPGYIGIDMEGGDITADLNDGIPLPDNSVGVIRAWHVLEHLRDPIKSMSEIHRVLADGGWALIQVPSTEGRGAFQDPSHVSYWNQNSFLYYTEARFARYIRNTSIRFQKFRCETYYPSQWWEDLKVPVVDAFLSAVKSDARRPYTINI